MGTEKITDSQKNKGFLDRSFFPEPKTNFGRPEERTPGNHEAQFKPIPG
jgi:hypothetical protein